jgi:hypothetical protein
VSLPKFDPFRRSRTVVSGSESRHAFSVLRQGHLAQQRLEARVAAQTADTRIDLELLSLPRTVASTACAVHR